MEAYCDLPHHLCAAARSAALVGGGEGVKWTRPIPFGPDRPRRIPAGVAFWSSNQKGFLPSEPFQRIYYFIFYHFSILPHFQIIYPYFITVRKMIGFGFISYCKEELMKDTNELLSMTTLLLVSWGCFYRCLEGATGLPSLKKNLLLFFSFTLGVLGEKRYVYLDFS